MAATETTTRIYELQVKLASDSLRALQRIQGAADNLDKKFTLLKSSIANALGNLGSQFIHQGISSLTGYLGDLVDELARMYDVSKKLNITTESLSGLGYAAKLTGSNMEDLQAGLTKLAAKMQEAASGNKTAVALFKDLGVSIYDAHGNLKAVDEAFLNIADRFKAFKDGSAEAALALDTFSRNGAEFVQLLNQGSDGISNMEKEAKDLGITVDGDLATAANNFNANIEKLKGSLSAAAKVLLQEFLPQITDLIGKLLEAIKVSHGFLDVIDNFMMLGGDELQIKDQIHSINVEIAKTNELMKEGVQIQITRGGAVKTPTSQSQQIEQQEHINKLLEQRTLLLTELDRREQKRKTQDMPADVYSGLGTQSKTVAAGTVAITRTVTDAGKAAHVAQTEFEKLNATFADQINGMERLGASNDAYMDALQKIDAANGKISASEKEKLLQQAEEIDILAQLNDERQKEADLKEEGKKLTESLLSPMEEYNATLKHLQELYDAGAISVETWGAGIKKAGDTLINSAEKQKAALTGMDEILANLGDKIDGYGKDMAGALVDFATHANDAKTAFTDFATSVLKDLLQMATQIAIMEPVIAAFKAMLGPGFKLTAKGDAFANGNVIPFARGGVVTSPTLFPMANGMGLMGEAGPEAVMPLKRNANGELGVTAQGSGGVTVNVYNETKSDVSTQSKTDKDGKRTIDIFIRNAVKQGISSGAFDGVLNTTFGLNRKGAT